jgi:hypothetical protein
VVAVLILATACQPGGTGGARSRASARRTKTVMVPASIPSDCSAPVEGQIMNFLRSVPDGATVLFPRGACYAEDNTILVADRAHLTLDGQGSTFEQRSPPNLAVVSNANWRIAGGTSVAIKDVVIRGTYQPPPRGTAGQGQRTDHGISIWGANGVSISDVQISNVDGDCLTADSDIRKGTDYRLNPPSRNVTVDRLQCAHAARQGVAATDIDGFTLSNSSIDDTQQTGVDIEIDAPGELARNINILTNTFDGVYFSAVAVPLGNSPDVGNVTISGNTMVAAPDTCYPAIYVGDPRFHLRDITISENTIMSLGDGIRVQQVDSGVVRANVIRKSNPGNTACDNPAVSPPQSMPVRLVDSTMTVDANQVQGFAAG